MDSTLKAPLILTMMSDYIWYVCKQRTRTFQKLQYSNISNSLAFGCVDPSGETI